MVSLNGRTVFLRTALMSTISRHAFRVALKIA